MAREILRQTLELERTLDYYNHDKRGCRQDAASFLFIFKRVWVMCVCNPGRSGPWFTMTDSFFMRGPVYVSLPKKIKGVYRLLVTLNHDKIHVHLPDGHSSQVFINFEVRQGQKHFHSPL